jgi:uncharacterized sporulation protein YeaH/YhbH (DUF444 family)
MQHNPIGRRGQTIVELSPADWSPQELLRISRLSRELRLTDQILSIDVDTVSVVQNGPAPAWTTLEGDAITFSMGHMPKPWGRVDVAIWLGTNAHELGHVLYSPRRHSLLMERVIEGDKLFLKGVAQLHNIVEDQRQERWLLTRFSPWRSYLVAALGHHLKADSNGAWLLMAGRTWLPNQVRDTARAAFVTERSESAALEVAQLVGEYQRLTDPGQTEADEAWDILVRLHTLFDLDVPTGGCGGGVIVDGEPSTDEPDGESWPTADEADGDDSVGDDGDGDDDLDGDGDGDGGDTDDDADGDGGTSGKGDSDKPDKDDSDSHGTGAGKDGTPPTFDNKRAKQELKEDARKDLMRDPAAKADLDDILNALDYGRTGGNGIEGDPPEGAYQDATDAAHRLHYEVADALRDIKDESEPGWVRHVSHGRLNIRRLLNPRLDPDTLFDRYDPGQMDATELELVVILDVSGSMRPHMQRLGEATWAIHQSVDDIEGRATILTFCSGEHRVLAMPGQRPDSRMFVPKQWGGTEPESALRAAFNQLAESRARNRMVVILTDGEWYGGNGDRVVAAMREVGITTVLAYMPESGSILPGSTPQTHGVEFFEVISQPSDLALLFRNVAMAQMGQW